MLQDQTPLTYGLKLSWSVTSQPVTPRLNGFVPLQRMNYQVT